MARFELSFDDGKTKKITRKPVHLLRTERTLSADSGAQEQVLVSLWFAATGKPVFVMDEFNAWVEKLEDWEMVKEGDPVPPVLTPADSPG